MTERPKTDLVEPLITSAEAYPKLESMVAAARRRVLLSFRIFDTRTSLRTAEARSFSDGSDWAALLLALAKKGVDVRLQVADFDPIGGAELHRDAWASLKHLDNAASASPEARGKIEAMAARHPASVGPVWRRAFSPLAKREAKRIANEYADKTIEEFPGLADVLNGATPHLYPATHHQKMAIVDDEFALIGGIDVNERRWDTPDHDRPAEQTWRDISLAIHGPKAMVVAKAAIEIWNRCAQDFQADQSPRPKLTNLKQPQRLAVEDHPDMEGFSVQLTASTDAGGLLAFGPKTTDDGTLQTVLSLVRSASRFLYIETQYFRSNEVAQALADAARANPELELVMVLPFAPEEFAFTGKRDAVMRHAEALQMAAIKKVKHAFGGRMAILSPAKPTRKDSADKFVAYGAGIVYVHSKVLIADSHTALVGSANLNGRSLLWDTEASVLWRDRVEVARFFETIGVSLLGEDHGPLDDVATWRAAADHNRSVAPDLREGFLLPYNLHRPHRFSRRAYWMPDAFF